MKTIHKHFPFIAAAALLAAGCAALPSSQDLDREALAVIKAGFRDEGIAKVDRIQQDLGQAASSSDTPPPDAVADQVMLQARVLLSRRADGLFMRRLPQRGRPAHPPAGPAHPDEEPR